MDKFAAIKAFRAVAEEAGFAAAARRLGMSRSQVNRLVIQLEDSLGVSLFARTTRKVQLSPQGKAYLDKVALLITELENTEYLLRGEQGEPRGEIRINAPMSFGTLYLSKVMVVFMQRYPEIRIQLVLSDARIDPLTQGFDMTLRIGEPSDNSSLIEQEIIDMPRILCASPTFISSAGTLETLRDLKLQPCLHYGNLPNGNRWKLLGPQGERSIQVQGTLCSNNGEVLCEAAIAGLGITMLPLFIVGREIQMGRLAQVLPDYQGTPLSLSLVYPPQRHLAGSLRVLITFLQQAFGEVPPWMN